jgi:hypothetical protein
LPELQGLCRPARLPLPIPADNLGENESRHSAFALRAVHSGPECWSGSTGDQRKRRGFHVLSREGHVREVLRETGLDRVLPVVGPSVDAAQTRDLGAHQASGVINRDRDGNTSRTLEIYRSRFPGIALIVLRNPEEVVT